jgi:hypothetical protein
MVAGWRPDLAIQAAWNANPNDPAAVPSWSDLTALFLGASGIKRGKQYELDQVQASDPTLDFLDPNEYLNPGNPSSPYAPNLLPERQVLAQAVWPNPASGNHLNTGAQGVSYDPSFESYTTGTRPSWILSIGSGVNPTVQAANPQQGTKSLQYAVTAGGGENGVGLTVPCIPGRQYTDTIYVRQTAANTTQIFIDGGASGTSTTTINAYVRLSVTYTATQPTHNLWVASFTTGTTGTVNVDAIQHEQGSSASAFTTTGSVIYGLLLDYIEDLPSEWDQDTQGYLGLCTMTAVDAFAVLESVDLWTEYRNSVLAKKPDYYWPLDEPNGSTLFAEASGNLGPSLRHVDTGTPASTFTTAANNVPGDVSGNGLQIAGQTNGANCSGALLGPLDGLNPLAVGSNAASWGLTFGGWVTTTDTTTLGHLFGGDSSNQGTTNYPQCLLFGAGTASGQVILNIAGGNPVNGVSITSAAGIGDGKPHLVLGVITQAANSMTCDLWIDGVKSATTTVNVTTTFGSSAPDFRMQWMAVAAAINMDLPSGVTNGTFSHYAIWNRALTTTELGDLWQAGGKGYSGETSGARVTRYLGYGWNGTSAIDTGQSTMGVSTLTAGTSLLAACQSVATTENGNFFIDARGRAVFQSRTTRYLATTPAYTFGENTSGGELPYEGDVRFGFDNVQTYNDVKVNRSGGITAVAADGTSQKQFFRRSFSRDVNTSTDLEATDAANWILASHKTPVQRVDRITLNPVTYPGLWPVVLSLEIGTRVTIKKRSKAANAGAGLTQSGDFFVESIEHTNIDMTNGTWETVLLVSPAASALQPWILGDATYGLLDTTTRLGY